MMNYIVHELVELLPAFYPIDGGTMGCIFGGTLYGVDVYVCRKFSDCRHGTFMAEKIFLVRIMQFVNFV
jgi:hypothetical protein